MSLMLKCMRLRFFSLKSCYNTTLLFSDGTLLFSDGNMDISLCNCRFRKYRYHFSIALYGSK